MRDLDATIDALAREPLRTAFLVDFDGSLAPIVAHPDDAVPLAGAVDVLAELVAVLGRVAIVSGRSVDFLARHLPVPGLALAGLYGMERLVGGERQVDATVVPYLPRIAAVADEAERRLPGVLVERKAGLSVTLHWRTAPEREDEIRAVAAELAARHGLHAPQRGRRAVELRPPVALDKGTAVEQLVDGYAVAAFAGDDLGDVPAFRALQNAREHASLIDAHCIAVASDEMPAEIAELADVVVAGPQELLDLMDALATRATQA
jgi:trehalose 6-phosphate phosphatase